MKGIIAAGGLGTRLRPLTYITNKHLLPVFNKPMILYPIETLKKSGIEEIMIVCGKEHAGHFMNFLGSGADYDVKLSYSIQGKDDAGIADVLKYAKNFTDKDGIAFILGDNIFENDFKRAIKNFKKGTIIFIKEVNNPERFGTPIFDKSGKKILEIKEKPLRPTSKYAQVGFYLFDNRVFEIIENLKPSARGQLEIVDVVNKYIKLGDSYHKIVRGFWSDAGTFDSLINTSIWAYKNQNLSK